MPSGRGGGARWSSSLKRSGRTRRQSDEDAAAGRVRSRSLWFLGLRAREGARSRRDLSADADAACLPVFVATHVTQEVGKQADERLDLMSSDQHCTNSEHQNQVQL